MLGSLKPENSRVHHLSQTHIVLGRALARAGQSREAAAEWSRALEVLSDQKRGSGSPQMLDARARALLYLGRSEEAESIVTSLLESGYLRPDFVALCRERGLAI